MLHAHYCRWHFTKDELLASQHCAVTHQQCGFSYLLPLGFSASPWTQPRLGGSPAGGSNGRDTVRDLRSFQPQHTQPCTSPPRPATAKTESSTADISTSPPPLLFVYKKSRSKFQKRFDFGLKWWRERERRKTPCWGLKVLHTEATLNHPTPRDLPGRKPLCSGHGTDSSAARHRTQHRRLLLPLTLNTTRLSETAPTSV